MTFIDHMAHARLPVRNEPDSPPDLFTERQPHPLGLSLDKLESYSSKLAGIALAVCTLRGLLERSEAFKQHAVPFRHSKPFPWPLNRGVVVLGALMNSFVSDTLEVNPMPWSINLSPKYLSRNDEEINQIENALFRHVDSWKCSG